MALYLTILLNLLISSSIFSRFLMIFYIYNCVCYLCEKKTVLLLPFQSIYFFSFLYHGTTNTSLNRSSDSRYPCLILFPRRLWLNLYLLLDLKSYFIVKCDVGCRSFVNTIFKVRKFPRQQYLPYL